MGFEPTTVGFGVQRSTVGATPSPVICFRPISLSTQFVPSMFVINNPIKSTEPIDKPINKLNNFNTFNLFTKGIYKYQLISSFRPIMNETQHQSESPSKTKDQNGNFLVVNSFSKNVLSHPKKYMTNKKISLAKHSFLKPKPKHDHSNLHEASKSASVVNLEF